MRVGLLFGSFNPITIAHLLIARYAYEQFSLDKVEFVLSPKNPLKDKSIIFASEHRVVISQLAIKSIIQDSDKFTLSLVEFDLPTPSYTVDTLKFLEKTRPDDEFYIIIGSDCLDNIDEWKEWEYLCANAIFIVYPRESAISDINDFTGYEFFKKGIHFMDDCPKLDISSTEIRKRIREGKSVQFMIPENAYGYTISCYREM